ncbi:MAG: glycosyltransferase family 39 protein [Actinobacteria bacterium]|nr:glycosyltransferase family 39 protein [Actinomycetota bacterium]
MSAGTIALRRAAGVSLRRSRAAVREQALVASGQILSGVGNLLFAAVMARMLTPGGFAELAAFLALYLLIAVPSLSFAAGGALDPERARRRRGRVLAGSIPVSLAIAAGAVALAPSLGLSVASALALATTPTLVALIELDRGRLYGERAYGWVTGSLVAEPAVRLAVGTVLAASLGVAGGAAGVVAGGIAGLVVARAGRGPARPSPSAVLFAGQVGKRNSGARGARAGGPASRVAAPAFLFLAVVQCQDIVFANATLSAGAAARFAAISTLGGAAVFATATIPFVLMPRAKAGEPGALGAALGTAALLGGAAALVTLIAAEPVLTLAYGGGRFDGVASFLPAYMLAMALLGLARVLAADAVARGGRRIPWIALGAGALQLGLLFAIGDSAEGVGLSTLIAASALTAALGLERAVGARAEVPTQEPLTDEIPTDVIPINGDTPHHRYDDRPPRRAPARLRDRQGLQTALILTGMVLVAIGLRLLAGRSLWLDEATSWFETQLPFHRMIEVLRNTDVHPPGYFTVLWATVRAFGDSELALRLPSLFAATALVPMLYVAGRAMYDRTTGLLAAGFAVVAPIVVWYSQEARMYAQLMLLATVAIWALYRALESKRLRYWLVYALAGAALAWTQYFAFLPLFVFEGAIALVAWQESRAGRPTAKLIIGGVLASLLMAALIAPLIPFAHHQFAVNQEAGKGFDSPSQVNSGTENQVSLYAALTNGIWAIAGYHSNATMANLTALWPLLILLALMLLGRGRSRATALLFAGVMVPTALLTALSLDQPFLFEVRYNLTAVPFLLLLGARAVTTWPHTERGRAVLAAAAIAALAAGFADQQWNGTNPRTYNFEGALHEVAVRSGPKDVLMYMPHDLNNLVAYYPPGLKTRRLGPHMPAAKVPRVFLMESFFEDPANREAVRKALVKLRRERTLTRRMKFSQVEVWEFR